MHQKHTNTLLHRQTIILGGLFFLIRGLSFIVRHEPVVQGVIVVLLLSTLVIVFFKNPLWSWNLVLGELLLNGAGHFFELAGVALRTWFLAVFLACWLIGRYRQRDTKFLHPPHRLIDYLLIALCVWALFGALHALEYSRSNLQIIRDLIPYAFFLLIFPAYEFMNEKQSRTYLIRLTAAFLVGSAIFSLFTFLLFSSGTEVIQGPYYKWFRDGAAGKITNLGNGFWRIVLPEHLFVSPILLVVSAYLMGKENKNSTGETVPKFTRSRRFGYVMLLLSALILALNLSRTYFLALLLGYLVLKYKHGWKQWIKVSLLSFASVFILFTSLHLLVSGGGPGWNLLGWRLGSIARPALEESAYTRTTLLQPIWQVIKVHPLIGTGLGATITFTNPKTNELVTTNQFDWGYFELMAELGLVGVVLFLLLLLSAAISIIKKIRPYAKKNIPPLIGDEGVVSITDNGDMRVGTLGVFTALAAMNVTAPVLFHVLGIVTMVIIISTFIQSTDPKI